LCVSVSAPAKRTIRKVFGDVPKPVIGVVPVITTWKVGTAAAPRSVVVALATLVSAMAGDTPGHSVNSAGRTRAPVLVPAPKVMRLPVLDPIRVPRVIVSGGPDAIVPQVSSQFPAPSSIR
jgi:hypothetical protein